MTLMIKGCRQVYCVYLLLKSQCFSCESFQVISIICQVAMSTEDTKEGISWIDSSLLWTEQTIFNYKPSKHTVKCTRMPVYYLCYMCLIII
jgi:hypothetical protein